MSLPSHWRSRSPLSVTPLLRVPRTFAEPLKKTPRMPNAWRFPERPFPPLMTFVRWPTGSLVRSVPTARRDVVWMDRPLIEDSRHPTTLRVAPLDVGGLLSERLFGRRTVVLTSATLALGGSFEPLARQWGLPPEGSDQPDVPGSHGSKPGADAAGDAGAHAADGRAGGASARAGP